MCTYTHARKHMNRQVLVSLPLECAWLLGYRGDFAFRVERWGGEGHETNTWPFMRSLQDCTNCHLFSTQGPTETNHRPMLTSVANRVRKQTAVQ